MLRSFRQAGFAIAIAKSEINYMQSSRPWLSLRLWAVRCPLCLVIDFLISAVRTLSTATSRGNGDR
jgi:hypothetical protein